MPVARPCHAPPLCSRAHLNSPVPLLLLLLLLLLGVHIATAQQRWL
jgi:hypothetical protein